MVTWQVRQVCMRTAVGPFSLLSSHGTCQREWHTPACQLVR